jgi:hypothetical protein
MASHEKNKISEHDFPGNFFEIENSYFMCHVVLRLDPWFLSCSNKSFEDTWLCNNMQVNCLSFFLSFFFFVKECVSILVLM